MFWRVRFCSVSDTRRIQSSPAAVPIYPARPVWYRVQTGAACPASGRVCRVPCLAWSVLHLVRLALLPVVCSPSGCAGGGWGLHPRGIQGAPWVGQVMSAHSEANKKGAFPAHQPPLSCVKHPTPIADSKNLAKKQKDPYKGSVFCAILALQALKGRNL